MRQGEYLVAISIEVGDEWSESSDILFILFISAWS